MPQIEEFKNKLTEIEAKYPNIFKSGDILKNVIAARNGNELRFDYLNKDAIPKHIQDEIMTAFLSSGSK
jgi:hypothetical protein